MRNTHNAGRRKRRPKGRWASRHLRTVPISDLRCDADPFAEKERYGGESIDRFPPRHFFSMYLDQPEQAFDAFAAWIRASHVRSGAWMAPKAYGGRHDGSFVRVLMKLHVDKHGIRPTRPSELDEVLVEQAIHTRVSYYLDLFDSLCEKGYVYDNRKPIECYREKGHYVIREGHHRISALRALGHEHVEVRLIKPPARGRRLKQRAPSRPAGVRTGETGASVLYITRGTIPSRRAMAVQTCRMASAMAENGHRVELVTQAAWPELWYRKNDEIVQLYGLSPSLRIRRLPLTPFSKRDAQGLLRKIPRNFDRLYWRMALAYSIYRRPDFIYTRYIAFVRHAVERGLPMIFETHKMPGRPHDPLCREVAALTHMPNFKAFITISPMIRDAYIELGADPDKCIVAGDGVDLKPFDAIRRDPRSTIANGDVTVGYCGHLYEGRGIDTLLACAALVPDLKFELVGGFPEDIERWTRRGQPSNVTFLGHVPHCDVPQQLARFDILCMPYSPSCETSPWMSPMKMFEYMAAGKAIVATDLPAVRPVLRHGHNALLCEPDDPRQLAEAISRLRADPSLRERLGRQARADVERHTWQKRARDIFKQIDRLDRGVSRQTHEPTKRHAPSAAMASLASQP